MKKDSKKFIKLRCSFLSFVTRPIVANTETFTNANPNPTQANNNFVITKLGTEGTIKQIMETVPKAINIAFL